MISKLLTAEDQNSSILALKLIKNLNDDQWEEFCDELEITIRKKLEESQPFAFSILYQYTTHRTFGYFTFDKSDIDGLIINIYPTKNLSEPFRYNMEEFRSQKNLIQSQINQILLSHNSYLKFFNNL